MSADTACFIDTNILVYAFDRSDKLRSSPAADLIGELLDSNNLRLSTQVLQEFFVTVTRKIAEPISTAEAIAVMDDLAITPVYLNGPKDIRDAALLSDEVKISFWDALIVVAAAHSGATRLYTEDLNHGQEIMGVEIANPFKENARKV